MPDQETYTDALNYCLSCIEYAADDTFLIVTLRRLAVLTANREDGPEKLRGFNDAFYDELSNVRYREQLAVVLRGRN